MERKTEIQGWKCQYLNNRSTERPKNENGEETIFEKISLKSSRIKDKRPQIRKTQIAK